MVRTPRIMNPYVMILTAEAYEYHKDYVSKSPELYQAATIKLHGT